jgi:Ner family transcriptional regulator
MIMRMDTKKRELTPDWHPADVKAALEKKGVSLRALAKRYGYSHIQRVLTSPWWAAEQLVAGELGVPADQIWPSRYTLSERRGKGMTRNEAAMRAVKKAARQAARGTK